MTPESTLIQTWIDKSDINVLLNAKGAKYRTLGLKELNLDESGKLEWLCKEPMLFKRPIVHTDKSVTVGFNEEEYNTKFL